MHTTKWIISEFIFRPFNNHRLIDWEHPKRRPRQKIMTRQLSISLLPRRRRLSRMRKRQRLRTIETVVHHAENTSQHEPSIAKFARAASLDEIITTTFLIAASDGSITNIFSWRAFAALHVSFYLPT